jgi:hypothetical protein
MTTVSNIPGTLNLTVKQGDGFSTALDFDTTMAGVTATTTIVSLVTGSLVDSFTTTVTAATAGQATISMTPTQTTALGAGTYFWSHQWANGSGYHRTLLSGVLEVTP